MRIQLNNTKCRNTKAKDKTYRFFAMNQLILIMLFFVTVPVLADGWFTENTPEGPRACREIGRSWGKGASIAEATDDALADLKKRFPAMNLTRFGSTKNKTWITDGHKPYLVVWATALKCGEVKQ